ncbi:unnamed protein product [Polarella glacialis]|uniref:Uncharacterized protein n=1 Tax=Polarella glacialis TaxID=89957 RepID=A0A813FK59_POLGL|nr:unnamed protein product [Polarella glacialis]
MGFDVAIQLLNRSLPQAREGHPQAAFLHEAALSYTARHMGEFSAADALQTLTPDAMADVVLKADPDPVVAQALECWAMLAKVADADLRFEGGDFACITWPPVALLLRTLRSLAQRIHPDEAKLVGSVEQVDKTVQTILLKAMESGSLHVDDAAASCLLLLQQSTLDDQYVLRKPALIAACAKLDVVSKSLQFPVLSPATVADLLVQVARKSEHPWQMGVAALIAWAGEKADDSDSVPRLTSVFEAASVESRRDLQPMILEALQFGLERAPCETMRWLSEPEGLLLEAATIYYAGHGRDQELASHPMLSTLSPCCLLRVMGELDSAAWAQVLHAWKLRRVGGWADFLPELWDRGSCELTDAARRHIADDLRCADAPSPEKADDGIEKRGRISFEQEDQLRRDIEQMRINVAQIQRLADSVLSAS